MTLERLIDFKASNLSTKSALKWTVIIYQNRKQTNVWCAVIIYLGVVLPVCVLFPIFARVMPYGNIRVCKHFFSSCFVKLDYLRNVPPTMYFSKYFKNIVTFTTFEFPLISVKISASLPDIVLEF